MSDTYPTELVRKDSLWIALFVAALLHIILILGVNFSTPPVENFNKSISVTLVNTPAKKPPKKARFLAQDNQIGTGESSKEARPLIQKLPSLGEHPDKPIKKLADEESKAKAAPVSKTIVQQKETLVNTVPQTTVMAQQEKEQAHLSAETLQQQIMQLGAEVAAKKQSADETKIKFVESISAHKYLAAQYIIDFTSKVERIGNLNFPELAVNKNFSGITIDIAINADGSIYSIVITNSSGNPALDKAAEQIIRMSAPFAPLPLELQKEVKILAFSRRWAFLNETMTAQ